jgi:dienelactone hydrolase
LYLLKTYYNISKYSYTRLILAGFILLFSLGVTTKVHAQKTVISFPSADSLDLTADLYFLADTLPYLILLHEQGSSRGEFESLAERFQKMDYNCLAVDIRNGGNANFISNETVRRSRHGDYILGREEVENDIRASVNYAFNTSGKEVVLLGSGATASLCMKLTKEMDEIKGVIALSPGEFFAPFLSIQDTISNLQKPVLIASTKTEHPYIEQMLSGIDEEFKTSFMPEADEGMRGTWALRPENPSNGEYWLAILLFFKELK